MTLPAFAQLPSYRALLAVSFALGLAMCALPLVSVLGVESALLLGIVLPPMACALAARSSLAARLGPTKAPSWLLLWHALGAGLSLLLVPVLLLALNAVRVRNCAPLEGLLFIALGPGAGVCLAAIAGVFVGALPLSGRLGTWLAALLPLVPIAASLTRMYTTPGIFAYGHFFGYFAGTLYDEVMAIPQPLWSLRRLTLAWAVVVVCALLALRDPTTGRLSLALQPGRRTIALLCGVALLYAVSGELRGASLGHRASSAHIEEVLGATHRSQRCVIHHARELRREAVLRFAADCDINVRRLGRWFGVRHPRPIGVYLFRSASEKRYLMGAADTNLAKPWRNEIYLQQADWPHPVMPHELAHIIAANIGRGPFRATGRLGGLWPDLALIEGVAVAAVWPQSSRSGMTPHQWTRALLELNMAAPLHALLGAGFLGQQKRMAYTLSGSLLRFIADTEGHDKIRAIYRSGDVAGTLGVSLSELERRWHAYVRQVPLPEAGRALVQQRFAGSSILSTVCPHQKAELKGELSGLLSAGRDSEAARVCREILDIDPAESGTRAALAGILARTGDREAAAAVLSQLQHAGAPPSVITAARQLLADEAWRSGRTAEAAAGYRALLREPSGRDARRQLEVKQLGLAAGGRQAQLIFELLVGEPGASIDGAVAVHLIRELRAERTDGLAHYLEARQLFFRDRYASAAQLLSQSRALGLPTRSLEIEALRVEAIARAALTVGPSPQPAQRPAADALLRQLEQADDVDLAIKAEAADWRTWLRLATTLGDK